MNRDISSEGALNEKMITRLKRFKILSDKYRNRRKRFGLRFNLIAAIQNWELKYDKCRFSNTHWIRRVFNAKIIKNFQA